MTPSDVLDDLDGERPGEPFTVQARGRTILFRPAAGPAWQDLMQALRWPPAFVATFGPADPDDLDVVDHLPAWQLRLLMHRWRVHYGLGTDDSDNIRLAAMLGKPAYRDAAERDLWEIHRLDLTGEWRSRRWRRLLNLLDGLRRTSHVSEVMTLDEELAELHLERESKEQREGKKEPTKRTRRMSEFTVEAELLSYAVDRLGELIIAQAAGRGARRRKVEPMPRPDSALHRVRQRRSRSHHQYTVARMFGYIDEKGQPRTPGPPTSPQ